MSLRVDPDVPAELARYGGDTAVKCFNCGNCTAVCRLTNQESVFPRRYIRYIQMGLKEKMRGSLDPWLCYYCGSCSDTCPREAEPGKLMMASRRWLIATYDWTGLSRVLYRHEGFELAALAMVALLVLALFTVPAQFGARLLSAHPEAWQSVNLAWFAPKEMVHRGDVVLAILLAGLLLSNASRMAYWVRRQGTRASAGDYLIELREFVTQGLTQKRWRDCMSGSSRHWIRHLLLVTGYGTMMLLVVVFLRSFQIEDASFHWTSILGYYSTLVLAGAALWIIQDRRRRRDQIHKYTDLADWLFVFLLLLTALSGIALHLARLLDFAVATYVLYVAHLMIAVPMLVVEVPFGKWSHLFYRPLALYLEAVEHRAQERRGLGAGARPVAA